ncbi:MAG: methylmalonyl Co-A mutase-associated GTPase MeaB [Bacteroidetes bacterium]|nr:methylmalonyl Co-A mutase-associated GTPase MeaB [Bacteroidota bacterium]
MDKTSNTKDPDSYRPDWQPENAGDEYAVRVVKGVNVKHDGLENSKQPSSKTSNNKPSQLSIDEYIEGVLKDDRNILARTITLIESNSLKHREVAKEVLERLLPKSGKSLRIGITGVPGAGKSTLIETLGMNLINQGHKVAVLAVDPSSTVTRGSILGDKTRMEKLSREQNCFIRPSPSGGTLGGVTRKSRETMTVCEAAGFDVILIETVGVGQSEVTVRSMVDFFLLVLIAGAGDELQGIKKGVIELADAILINKADGENLKRANLARSEYTNALHYLKPATEGWETRAHIASALTGSGISDIWNVIKKHEEITLKNGVFEDRRKNQALEWVFKIIEDHLKENFFNDSKIIAELPNIKRETYLGKILPTHAAEKLLDLFKSPKK